MHLGFIIEPYTSNGQIAGGDIMTRIRAAKALATALTVIALPASSIEPSSKHPMSASDHGDAARPRPPAFGLDRLCFWDEVPGPRATFVTHPTRTNDALLTRLR